MPINSNRLPKFSGQTGRFNSCKKNFKFTYLRKDFIFDEIQVYESRAIGSDCILIIMAALTDNEAKCIEKAIELGMDVI